ncbi:RDD family protein [Rhodococcus sp. HNM0569]|uniref:RDD family protein n=1 Tax=Rhodococcus sp. HNM0569 TaxID=2716340 RepID=UPI00146C9C7A|nr:RDD family protein [Rhodococcus sp. HNM0569]NLU83499.1 RDD family protein [Rhodococcus sp. HNM0569]
MTTGGFDPNQSHQQTPQSGGTAPYGQQPYGDQQYGGQPQFGAQAPQPQYQNQQSPYPQYPSQPQGGQQYGTPPGYGPGMTQQFSMPPQFDQQFGRRPADLGKRFVARFIDGLITGLPSGIVGGLIVIATGGSYAGVAIAALLTALVPVAYFVALETSRGATLGKQVMGLSVTGPNGENPTPQQSLQRNAFYLVALLGLVPALGVIGNIVVTILYIVIAVTISQSPTKQGLHDRFAGGTQVTQA